MKRIGTITAIIGIATAAILFCFCGASLASFYEKRLQSPFFTAFLTLGSFLLALQTTILMRLKTDLYDKDAYKARVKRMNELNPEGNKISVYGPLKRLGSFLIQSVLLALGASVAQMTIGFIPHPAASAFCIGLAASAISMVFLAWREMRHNLEDWFDFLEKEEQ